MRFVFKLQSPLVHSAFSPGIVGNVVPLRRFPVLCGKKTVNVPAIAGNHLRGIVRRKLFRELFKKLDLRGEDEFHDAYAFGANGGYLDGFDSTIDPEKFAELRAACPPLSVLGSALGKFMIPGRVSFGIVWPVCDVTVDWGLVAAEESVPKLEAIESEIYHVRMPEREFTGKNEEQKPMPHGMETLNSGLRMETGIRFDDEAGEVEKAAIMRGLKLVDSLGGKSAAGLGTIKMEFPTFLDDRAYVEWLDSDCARKGTLQALFAKP